MLTETDLSASSVRRGRIWYSAVHECENCKTLSVWPHGYPWSNTDPSSTQNFNRIGKFEPTAACAVMTYPRPLAWRRYRKLSLQSWLQDRREFPFWRLKMASSTAKKSRKLSFLFHSRL